MPTQTAPREMVVNPADFQLLLTSRRNMIRENRRHQGLLGLRDRDTGELFLTEERKLKPVAV